MKRLIFTFLNLYIFTLFGCGNASQTGGENDSIAAEDSAEVEVTDHNFVSGVLTDEMMSCVSIKDLDGVDHYYLKDDTFEGCDAVVGDSVVVTLVDGEDGKQVIRIDRL